MEANEITETIAVGKKTVRLKSFTHHIGHIHAFMIPLWHFSWLFFFTYLRIMPIQYKLSIGHSLLFHHSDADARHLPVPKK